MRNCVIHRPLIVIEMKNPTNSSNFKKKILLAYGVIEDLIKKNSEVMLLDKVNPLEVVDLFKSGEEVTLYGAWLGMCLDRIYNSLVCKGVKVNYSPNGCV